MLRKAAQNGTIASVEVHGKQALYTPTQAAEKVAAETAPAKDAGKKAKPGKKN